MDDFADEVGKEKKLTVSSGVVETGRCRHGAFWFDGGRRAV
jgi:hypothetical protein